MRLQRRLLTEQRSRLDAALQAIEQAEQSAGDQDGPDWHLLRAIVEVLNVHKNSEWMKKFYTEEQLADLAKRSDPDVRSKGERDWAELIADAEAALVGKS